MEGEWKGNGGWQAGTLGWRVGHGRRWRNKSTPCWRASRRVTSHTRRQHSPGPSRCAARGAGGASWPASSGLVQRCRVRPPYAATQRTGQLLAPSRSHRWRRRAPTGITSVTAPRHRVTCTRSLTRPAVVRPRRPAPSSAGPVAQPIVQPLVPDRAFRALPGRRSRPVSTFRVLPGRFYCRRHALPENMCT